MALPARAQPKRAAAATRAGGAKQMAKKQTAKRVAPAKKGAPTPAAPAETAKRAAPALSEKPRVRKPAKTAASKKPRPGKAAASFVWGDATEDDLELERVGKYKKAALAKKAAEETDDISAALGLAAQATVEKTPTPPPKRMSERRQAKEQRYRERKAEKAQRHLDRKMAKKARRRERLVKRKEATGSILNDPNKKLKPARRPHSGPAVCNDDLLT